MQLIGFNKRIDLNLESLELPDDIHISASHPHWKDIIQYLSNGEFLSGAMSYIYDEDGTPIGNLDYYTDGIFIWPSYYVFYLNKDKEMKMNKDFYENMKKNNWTVPSQTEEELVKIELFFDQKWSKKPL